MKCDIWTTFYHLHLINPSDGSDQRALLDTLHKVQTSHDANSSDKVDKYHRVIIIQSRTAYWNRFHWLLLHVTDFQNTKKHILVYNIMHLHVHYFGPAYGWNAMPTLQTGQVLFILSQCTMDSSLKRCSHGRVTATSPSWNKSWLMLHSPNSLISPSDVTNSLY